MTRQTHDYVKIVSDTPLQQTQPRNLKVKEPMRQAELGPCFEGLTPATTVLSYFCMIIDYRRYRLWIARSHLLPHDGAALFKLNL